MRSIDFTEDRNRKMYSIGMHQTKSDHFIIQDHDIFINPNFQETKNAFFSGDDHFDQREFPKKDHKYTIFLYDIIYGVPDSHFAWFLRLIKEITGDVATIYIPEMAISFKRLLESLCIEEFYTLKTFKPKERFIYPIDDHNSLFMKYDDYRIGYFILCDEKEG